MSNWTHVAGVMRIDALRFDDPYDFKSYFDDLIGKQCLYNDDERVWKDKDKHPNEYLPMGSEGSLQKHIWINPDKSCLAAYTVTIFGDLRDHDNPQEIVDWFKEKCENLNIRQATISVDNELNGTINYTYSDKD